MISEKGWWPDGSKKKNEQKRSQNLRFFVYDIVLVAKTEDNDEQSDTIQDVIIEVTDPVEPKEPEKIVVSDKVVFLAHLTADRKDYTFL